MKDLADVFIHIISQLAVVLTLLYSIGDDLVARFILLMLVILFPFISYIRWYGINSHNKNIENTGLGSYKKVLMNRGEATLYDKIAFISYLLFIVFAFSFYCIKLYSL